MDEMTPKERVTFARGKVRSNLENIRTTLDHQRRDVANERQMWIVTACFMFLILIFAFLYHGIQSAQDIVFDFAIMVSFIIVHVMCYNIIGNQIMFSNLLLELHSDLVNSEALRFGTEHMAVGDDRPGSR